MKYALWIAQGLLAFAFIGAGTMKMITPYEALVTQMTWVSSVPSWMPAFIGLVEVAGGIGVILPALTRIKPWLTPLAAIGLEIVMILAAGLHLMRGEFSMLGGPLVLAALAGFVAYGRLRLKPILSRAIASV